MDSIDDAKNEARMGKGELYYAFTPTLVAKRNRCHHACHRFNHANSLSRRKRVELWKDIACDVCQLPPPAPTEEEDTILLQEEPYVDGPIKIDYGFNVRLGKGVQINYDCTFIDTCPITIGARTLVGPNCSFYSGTHPLDPFLRNGIKGPELGAPITIGEDCWFGGNAIVCPGVTIGRGATIGAGSVVTKDIEEFSVAAGNPARVIRKIVPEALDPRGAVVGDERMVGATSST